MGVIIYHNPRCSKSRLTLELIKQKNIEPTVVEYLKSTPGRLELTNIIKMLKKEPRDVMRKGEAIYKELNLNNPALTNSELIAAMAKNPIFLVSDPWKEEKNLN